MNKYVIAGLGVIALIFQLLNDRFLSPDNLTNLLMQMAPTGVISLGIIMVLLLGEIDLSAGSVSGLAAVIMAVLSVQRHMPIAAAILIAIVAAIAIGALHGFMFTAIGMPSFVVTLAGLIGWLGLLLYLLRRGGTINLPFKGFVAQLSGSWLPTWLSFTLLAVGVTAWVTTLLVVRRGRAAAGLPVDELWRVFALPAVIAAVSAAAIAYLSADRGVPFLVVIFGSLVFILDLVLRHTVFGRQIFAVGGNAEAARRAGINITRVRVTAFMLCSGLAAVGGLLAASRLTAVNQGSGGSDILLMAIAAAVIGGTSLFGGRGSAWAAVLGILVIHSITNGMLLLSVDSSVRLMVTAGVLAAAVAVDSLARRGSTA